MSKHIIPAFIKKHAIDEKECIKSICDFTTFNDFFIRTLKPSARPIDVSASSIISPADGYLTIATLNNVMEFPIKGCRFTLSTLLSSSRLAQDYIHGTILLLRLAPENYHRFHFPITCTPESPQVIHGTYESVNPLVYRVGIQPLTTNERHVYVLKSVNCGDSIMVSVGALCVGKIVETYSAGKEYKKGEEAGYFCFGGSTLVVLFKQGMITIDQHYIEQAKQRCEVPIRLGQSIAYITHVL